MIQTVEYGPAEELAEKVADRLPAENMLNRPSEYGAVDYESWVMVIAAVLRLLAGCLRDRGYLGHHVTHAARRAGWLTTFRVARSIRRSRGIGIRPAWRLARAVLAEAAAHPNLTYHLVESR